MIAIRNYTDNDLPALLDFIVPRREGADPVDSAAHRSVFADIIQLPGRNQERDCLLLFDEDEAGRPALREFCLVFPEPRAGRCVLNVHVSPGRRLRSRLPHPGSGKLGTNPRSASGGNPHRTVTSLRPGGGSSRRRV